MGNTIYTGKGRGMKMMLTVIGLPVVVLGCTLLAISCVPESCGSCYRIKNRTVYLHYYGGYPWGRHHYIEVTGSHAASFRYYEGSRVGDCQTGSFYARDHGQVYHRSAVVEGADLATFAPAGNGYALDKSRVYYRGQPLQGADPNSFFVIENRFQRPWAADHQGVFYMNSRISALIDAKSFRILHPPFFKDVNGVYAGMAFEPLPGVDPQSLVMPEEMKVLRPRFYFWDRNGAYYYEKVTAGDERVSTVEGVDLRSFQPLSDFYANDNFHVYYKDLPMKDADPKSFKVIPGSRGKRGRDHNHIYLEGKPLRETKVDLDAAE